MAKTNNIEKTYNKQIGGENMEFIFLHDCNDCKHYDNCDEEKVFSTDCKKFEYKEDL